MSRLLYRVGRACTRHRRLVLGAWAVALIAVAAAAVALGERTSDDLTLPGTGSTAATDLLDAKLPKEANGSNPIVLEPPTGRLTGSANRRVVMPR